MSFISLEYVFLFILTIGLYYVLPHRFRWLLLLAASYTFYMFWKPSFIVLLLASTAVDYFAGIQMGKTEDKKKRKKYLLLSLLVNLGLLGFFKYFGMLDNAVSSLFSSIGINYQGTGWNILLPIGISFYTFQTLGYSIDVYRGTIKPERHFGYFALYVSFFPQLVAGPIERASNLLPQLRKKFIFDYHQSVEGMMLVCWGFFKKVIIADRIAVIIDSIFASPGNYNSLHLLLAGYVFLYQLYFDFSSYTDIARGTAKILGIELIRNFDRPFAARTLSDLWSRWHMSLTYWFRDYLSVPLYKKFRKKNKTLAFILSTTITLSLCGLWHGADWTFIIWGLYIAIVMIIGNKTRPYRNRITHKLGIDRLKTIKRMMEFLTVMFTVAMAMVFFRASDMSAVVEYYRQMLAFNDIPFFMGLGARLGISTIDTLILLTGIVIVEITQYIYRDNSLFVNLRNRRPVFRYAVYIGLAMFVLIFGKFGGSPYVYFQF